MLTIKVRKKSLYKKIKETVRTRHSLSENAYNISIKNHPIMTKNKINVKKHVTV